MVATLAAGFLLVAIGIYGRVLEGLPSASDYQTSNKVWGTTFFIVGGSLVVVAIISEVSR